MITHSFRLRLTLLIGLLLTACSSSDPQVRMEEAVSEMIDLAEDKNFQALESYIHSDFKGADNRDKNALLSWANQMTQRYSHLNSAWTIQQVQYYPDVQRGTVVLKGGMTGHAGLLPKQFSRLLEVRIDLIFENDQWKVIGLEYSQASS